MKNSLLLISLVILIACSSCGNTEKTDNAQLETDISPVIPKINATVRAVRAEDNLAVKEGDTLVLLDDAPYKIAVSQAEVAVAQARQNVALARNNKNTVSNTVNTASANSSAVAANIQAAKAGVAAAKVKLDVASKNFERIENLYNQTSATMQQFDYAKAEKDGAAQGLISAEGQFIALQKQVDATRSQVATTQTTVATSADNISLAELAVKQAENNLEMAKLQLSYCVITSPSNGVVSKKNVQKGQVVGVGQPLMAITSDKIIWVVANFKETQLEKIKVGQSAEINVDTYGNQTFIGKVASISPATGARFSLLPQDNATGNFVKVTQRIPVKIVFTEQGKNEYPLRAGMSVSVKVKTTK